MPSTVRCRIEGKAGTCVAVPVGTGPGTMSSITEIQQAILVLPETEYVQLREWISELDWERWDREIEADSEAGRLGFLIAEAREAREHGVLDEL